MSKPQRKMAPELKFKLAIEALKGEQAVTQIASEHGIHPKQIRRWRDQLIAEGESIFIHKATQKSADPDKEKLLNIINHLNLELDFLKKKLKRNG
jgi:transposase-like protein